MSVQVKVVPRPGSAAQQVYVPAIIRGLGVTMRHFFDNLFGGGKHIVTVQYPEEKVKYPPRYRGLHRLMTREDGSVRCVACMCCPTVCPANCITIVAGEDPKDPAEKFPVVFNIDMLRCIYCGFCVEACPKDAIRMDTRIYEINAYTRQDMVHSKAYMVNLMDGAKPEAGAAYHADQGSAPSGYTMDEGTLG